MYTYIYEIVSTRVCVYADTVNINQKKHRLFSKTMKNRILNAIYANIIIFLLSLLVILTTN